MSNKKRNITGVQLDVRGLGTEPIVVDHKKGAAFVLGQLAGLFREALGERFGAKQEEALTEKYLKETHDLIQVKEVSGLTKMGGFNTYEVEFDDGTSEWVTFTIDMERNLVDMFK